MGYEDLSENIETGDLFGRVTGFFYCYINLLITGTGNSFSMKTSVQWKTKWGGPHSGYEDLCAVETEVGRSSFGL